MHRANHVFTSSQLTLWWQLPVKSQFCQHSITNSFLGVLAKLRKANISFLMSCLSAWNNSAPHWTDFHKTWHFSIFWDMSWKFMFQENLTKITGPLHKDQHTFLIICHSLILRKRNVSDECCRENQNTHFMFNNFFSRKSCQLLCGKIWWAGQATDDITQHMRIACWITKATNTHLKYVILIVCPLQQWLHKHASMLCHTYTACLV